MSYFSGDHNYFIHVVQKTQERTHNLKEIFKN